MISEESKAFEISVVVSNVLCFVTRQGIRYQMSNQDLVRQGVYACVSVRIDGKSIGYSKSHEIGHSPNVPVVFRYMTTERNVTYGVETRSELMFMAPQVVYASTYGAIVNKTTNQLSAIQVGVILQRVQRDTTDVSVWCSLVNNDLPIKFVDASKKFHERPSVTVASGLKSVVDIRATPKSHNLSNCLISSKLYIESETNLEILRKVTAAAAPQDLKRARDEVDEVDDDVIEVPRVKREKKIEVVDLT